MNFIETRGNDGEKSPEVTFSEAILGPMCSYGGIYSPDGLPDLGDDFLRDHIDKDYKTLARDILNAFQIDIKQTDIDAALDLYDDFDDVTLLTQGDANNPAPLVKIKDDLFVSELYHGPTRAFKDMALQPFGSVLSSLAQQRDEEYLILAATSGDTGPAALDTFKNRKNIRVACLYPDGGTSDVQRLQMVTEDAPNLKVIGIHGDFDDAQAALKLLLSSDSFKAKLKEKNISLSAANSVNFGRIIFQLMYHIHSYLELVRQDEINLGDNIYINVPSGNFGNALGGYYAMKMGLPIERILIASNQNNVLTELINNGIYDISGTALIATSSPAMDILKSSNIERILFDMFGAARTKDLMTQLDTNKRYELEADELAKIQSIFAADFCTDEEGKKYLKQSFDDGYLMDPHTATCFKTYDNCREKPLKTIFYSTAEWTKFSPTIASALTGETGSKDIDALKAISAKAEIEIPLVISELFDKDIAQSTVINKQDIEKEILAFLD